MIVKRSNKSRKTDTNVPDIQYAYVLFNCCFLTLPSFFGILGMLSGGFYTSQTLDILLKMPLIYCCRIGNDES